MSDSALSTTFTPERARRYVAEALPPLLTRAAANLGVPDSDGNLFPSPNAQAARVSLLSAAEVLDELGPLVGDDVLLPPRAALKRLQALFTSRHPDLSLEPPARPATTSLEEMVAAAWEDGGGAAPPPVA